MNERELTGRARTHVAQHDGMGCAMAPEALAALLALRAEGEKRGFLLAPYSSFRDFAAQTRIWNRKARGEATLYGPRGEPLSHAALSKAQVVDAILAWSALPGASRHHWGSDVDVYDAARVPDRSKVGLLPAETAPGGPFREMFLWPSEAMGDYGFFRPYDRFRGGFNPEDWHLSYAPVAAPALAALTAQVVEDALRAEGGIELFDEVSPRLGMIHERYVRNVAPVPGTTRFDGASRA